MFDDKMKKNLACGIILVFLVLGCEDKPPDNVYRATEIDSLNFLLKNSDLIALVNISDGMPSTDKATTELKEAVQARVVEVIFGEPQSSLIEILNTTVFTEPGIVEHKLYLSNGEFLYFLKKVGNSYKPLSIFSTVRFRKGKGAPIWKQDKTGSLPEIEKAEIIAEIRKAIEQGH